MCAVVWRLCCVCICVWPCLYVDCGCLHLCMHVSECVCLYGDCVVFVCISGHVYMVIVGVCVGACIVINVCVRVW